MWVAQALERLEPLWLRQENEHPAVAMEVGVALSPLIVVLLRPTTPQAPGTGHPWRCRALELQERSQRHEAAAEVAS